MNAKPSVALAAWTVSALSITSSARSEETFRDTMVRGQRELSVGVENDFWISDRYYTHGMRIAMTATDGRVHTKPSSPDSVPESWHTWYGFHLGHNMYTGSDIYTPRRRIPPTDRPYAGWTYIGAYRERVFSDDRSVYFEFDVGCIGPCSKAEQIQTWWHDELEVGEPRGWGAQIGNELAVQGVYVHRWPTWARCDGEGCPSHSPRRFDVSPHAALQAGNVFLTAGGGITARLGLYRMLGHAAGHGVSRRPPSVSALSPPPGGSGSTAASQDRPKEFFLYFRPELRVVGYNATLQGRVFASDVFTQSPKRLVLDSEFGAAAYLSRLALSAVYTLRSTEVDAQESQIGAHRWLQFRITYRL